MGRIDGIHIPPLLRERVRERVPYCPCLSSSVNLTPRLSSAWVAASKSEPNWAKAATSRYWANSSFIEPATLREEKSKANVLNSTHN